MRTNPTHIRRLYLELPFFLVDKHRANVNILHGHFLGIILVLQQCLHGYIGQEATGNVAEDLAISIDLERFLKVSVGFSLVVEKGLVIFEPGADLQFDTT